MTEEIFFHFNRHPGSDGLDETAIREIADEIEAVAFDTDEYAHRSGEETESIYFVAKGRFKQILYDPKGNKVEEAFLARGGQFGILAAGQNVPIPVDLIAEEPSTLLKLDFQKALSLAARHREFQINLFRLAGNRVRQILTGERIQNQPSTVLVVNHSSKTRSITPRLVRRLAEIEKSPCVLSDDSNWEEIPGVHHLFLGNGDQLISLDSIRRQITEWSTLGRIFIDVDLSFDFEMLCEGFASSEEVLWCLCLEDHQSDLEILKDLEKKAPRWMEKTNLVWLLDGEEQVAPIAPELRSLVTNDFKISFSEPAPNKGNLLVNGIERIIHHLRGVKVGLALGGGAARGMAHLGVLKVLEQNGIVIDMIAGTSAGALTGTVYSSGLEVDHSIDSFTKDLTPSWLYQRIPRGTYWYLLYKYRTGQFDPMLRNYLFDYRLEQHPLPINTVTVDLVRGDPVARSCGDSVEAILESMNLPVLSSPICSKSGQALVDGGLVNNVPADVLVGKGCNFVIAVTVTSKLQQHFANLGEDSLKKKQKSPSTLQTVMRSYEVQNYNMNSIGVQPADVIIAPDVSGFDLTEFTRTGELAAQGEKAALGSVAEIKTLLTQLDKDLFPPE